MDRFPQYQFLLLFCYHGPLLYDVTGSSHPSHLYRHPNSTTASIVTSDEVSMSSATQNSTNQRPASISIKRHAGSISSSLEVANEDTPVNPGAPNSRIGCRFPCHSDDQANQVNETVNETVNDLGEGFQNDHNNGAAQVPDPDSTTVPALAAHQGLQQAQAVNDDEEIDFGPQELDLAAIRAELDAGINVVTPPTAENIGTIVNVPIATAATANNIPGPAQLAVESAAVPDDSAINQHHGDSSTHFEMNPGMIVPVPVGQYGRTRYGNQNQGPDTALAGHEHVLIQMVEVIPATISTLAPASGNAPAPPPSRRPRKIGRFPCPHHDCPQQRNLPGKVFTRNDNLRAHLRLVHREDIPKERAGRRPRRNAASASA
ncbi:hypothetical protein BJ508DRAFT_380633 [Ascobolus immersus RN42]|uniref:C2H2-type domain-containing protein n=1 Tax=Ascobolus immersus RN42 TaxID=1160509 RepID=A0A3N4HKI6_ASCIM|nr:hypothetical protein BJ508DRAFT_380633 [Ascobolus immersus RN42]